MTKFDFHNFDWFFFREFSDFPVEIINISKITDISIELCIGKPGKCMKICCTHPDDPATDDEETPLKEASSDEETKDPEGTYKKYIFSYKKCISCRRIRNVSTKSDFFLLFFAFSTKILIFQRFRSGNRTKIGFKKK